MTGTEIPIAEFKERQRAMWGAGDYPTLSEYITDVGEGVVPAAGLEAGMRVLDVACGTGNAALPAARAGADVTGLDLVPALLEAGRAKAEEAGVPWAGFHAFRHTCATRLFAEGRNAVQVSRWLGHHSPAFTLSVYVGLLDGDLGEPLASSPNGSPRAALRALEGASIGSAQATDSRGISAQRVA